MTQVDTHTEQTDETISTAQADLVIAEYLEQHPDFFERHPELLERLNIQAKDSGAVSLSGIQMQRQRRRINELEEEVTQLMSLASANDRIFYEFMDLQTKVLGCTLAAEVVTVIKNKARELNLTAFVAVVDNPHVPLDKEAWLRFCRTHLNGKAAYLGRLKQVDRQGLFGEVPEHLFPELGSYVVLPLTRGNLDGCLIFASEDGGHFQPEQDTLFLRHLALVAANMLAVLPWK